MGTGRERSLTDRYPIKEETPCGLAVVGLACRALPRPPPFAYLTSNEKALISHKGRFGLIPSVGNVRCDLRNVVCFGRK